MADSGRRKGVLLGGKFIITDDGKHAKCTYCDKELKFHHSTSSLNYHLKTRHPFSSQSACSSTSTPTTGATSTSKQQQLMTIANCFHRQTTAKEEHNITKALCLWIARDVRPISIVEDRGLGNLLKVATGNQEYVLPGRTSMTLKLKDLYESQAVQVQSVLDQADSVVLALDYWTSIANDSYLGIYAFLVDREWELSCTTLGIDYSEEQHTSENIKQQVK